MEIDQPDKQTRRGTIWVLLSVMLVLTLLASALPQAPAAAVTCKYKHKVLDGETLTYIANLYGVYWYEIAQANSLQPPYTVSPGQVLCIPDTATSNGGTQATATGKNSKKATLTASIQIGNVYVAVENFKAKTSYYVRISPEAGGPSYKLGNFTTDKAGNFADWFRIPRYVPRLRSMNVCVKNVWTDDVSCAKISDLGELISIAHRSCQGKEGR
jgi:hypothetical protein